MSNTHNEIGLLNANGSVTPYGSTGGSGTVTANDVSFDNTTSGLPATEVQTAIDVIDAEVDDIVNVYGSKNLLWSDRIGVSETVNGVTFTINADGSVSTSGTSGSGATWFYYLTANDGATKFLNSLQSGLTYKLNGCPSGAHSSIKINFWTNNDSAVHASANEDNSFTKPPIISGNTLIAIGTDSSNISFNGLTFYPMVRDARITDSTYVPYAKTNRELTVDKVERADLTDVNIMGTTNTSGRLITTGMHFYLNNQFCRAKVDISVNAAFTLGTNYVVESAYKDSGWIPATLNTTYFSSGGVWYRTIGEKCYVTFQGCVPIAVADAIIATGLPKADTFFSGCATPESGSPGRAVFIQQNDTVLRTRLVDTETLCGSIEYLMM